MAVGRLRHLLLAATCTIALGLAACGDDEEPAAGTGATGPASSDIEQIRADFVAGAVDAAADQGATEAQLDCLRQEIDAHITDDMLLEAEETGDISPEVQQIAVDAGLACR